MELAQMPERVVPAEEHKALLGAMCVLEQKLEKAAKTTLDYGRRKVLVEVCCTSDSRLSTAIQKVTGRDDSVTRVSHWMGADLSTSKGKMLAFEAICEDPPDDIWWSPPCGPDSPMQNLGAKKREADPACMERYMAKKHRARRIQQNIVWLITALQKKFPNMNHTLEQP